MDCGPAALKCLLEGFSVNVSYGRLRDACQTDVDGTSIDTLEEVAIDLGLEAEQLIVPPDHLLLEEPSSLPAIVVVELSNGNTHFVVCWRKFRNWVQIMDPAVGRRWVRKQDFLNSIYRHTMTVPMEDWREWAGTDDFTLPLLVRMQTLGLTRSTADVLINAFCEDPEWHGLAFLDAAIRMIDSLVQSGGVQKGSAAVNMLTGLCGNYRQQPDVAKDLIPEHFWTVSLPSESMYLGDTGEADELLAVSGAVIVSVAGPTPGSEREEPHSEILRLALSEAPPQPLKMLLGLAKESGKNIPLVLMVAMAVAATGVLIEALLFFTLIDVHQGLSKGSQRLGFLLMVLALTASLLAFQFPVARLLARSGRHLEIGIRLLLFKKLPRIGDQYFSSRLQSDMAERSHMLYMIRRLPKAVEQLVVGTMGLAATSIGLIWLVPGLTPWLVGLLALIVLVPLLVQPMVSEMDLRVRSHVGALSNFYLDSLIGIVPIRAHSAEGSIRNAHESRLKNWAESESQFLRLQVVIQALQLVGGAVLIWFLVDLSIRTIGPDPVILLIVYWLLSLPVYGAELASALLQYPTFKNITLRILDPIQAPESHLETSVRDARNHDAGNSVSSSEPHLSESVTIDFRNVSAKAGGHTVLHEVNLKLQPGEHVAIVGESGAGKSSMVGLLLGWLAPEQGTILVNGSTLDNRLQSQLRSVTAWVDPGVQIWNDSLANNLRYGSEGDIPMSQLITQADLLNVLSSLEDGLATSLGEGGALVSGGEGQRVRVGRALGRKDASCVILDEPFRGLDRTHRLRFQERLRKIWQNATMLYISHDISDTVSFPRVIVMSKGRCIEDGEPHLLLKNPDSAYHRLYHDDQSLQTDCWQGDQWSHWRMSKGRLTDLTADQNNGGIE